MGNFKIGDKVEILNLEGIHLGNEIEIIDGLATVASISHDGYPYLKCVSGSDLVINSHELQYIRKAKKKKQRITTLEKTVEQQGKELSELKLIVHELRERKPSVFATLEGQDLEAEYAEQVKDEPSTDISVEDKRLTIGDLAKVVVKLTHHRANVGEIVKIVRDAEDRQPYYCERATDGTNLGWFKEEELERVDVIEFEGQQYRKVEREAVEGDVVIFLENDTDPYCSTINTPYLVVEDNKGKDPKFDSGCHGVYFSVYADDHNRTPETVDVYEPINQPVQHQTVPCSAVRPPIEEVGEAFFEAASKVLNPKTANELRGEVIEKAKGFVEEHQLYGIGSNWMEVPNITNSGHVKAEFVTNEEKSTVVALLKSLYSKKVVSKGIAKCNPSDVFNEHIGKAIALGRALGLDVSEFEQAVQPNEYAIGQIGINEILGFSKQYEITKIGKGDVFKKLFEPFDSAMGDTTKPLFYVDNTHKSLTIINDTNAIYGGVE